MKKLFTLCTALILFGSMSFVQADYYVAGTLNGWNAGDSNYKMSGSDPYSVTKQLNTGAYQFKITNGSWDWSTNSYDQSASNVTLSTVDGNISFTLSTTSDVTFYYNANSDKAYVQATPASVPSYTFPNGTTIYYDFTAYNGGVNVCINGQDVWHENTTAIFSETLNNAWEVTATTNLFKSAPNSWSYKTCSTLPTEGQNMLVGDADGIGCHWDTYSGGMPEPTPATIQLHSNITNPDWESSAEFTLASNEETASLTLTGVAIGSYEFGLKIDGTWTSNGSAFSRENPSHEVVSGSGNCTFNADVAGDYTFTWTYATNTLSVSYPYLPPTVEMKGGWDEWADAVVFAGNATSVSATKHLTAGEYEFKVIIGGEWRGNGYTYHRDYTGAEGIETNGENMKITADTEGDYTFTWTYETNAINITFPEVQEPDAFVAGSATDIFGAYWDGTAEANKMTWDEGLSKFTKTYTVDKAYKSVALKVVYDNQWYGVEGGEDNVKFSLSGAGTFTVLFDKTNHYVTLDGEIVGEEQFDFEYVTVAGNGNGKWLNGEDWAPTAASNRMTEVATDIYEISYIGVPAAESKFQFTFNGGWDYQFGGAFAGFGVATTAVYGNGGGDITFTPVAGSEITIRLDLSNFNFATKEGATFTVSQIEPIAEIGGKFIINAKGDTAVFSRGNLQYKQSADAWRCAPNQYNWAGEEANENMGNTEYAGWVDLFCWSLGAENNYGATSAYLSTAYHNKDFVDWGTKFEGEWSTLSSAQWNYLLNSRAGANDKWGMAMIEDNLGMILLPNDWEAPAGVNFVPRTNPTSELWDNGDMIDNTYDHYRVHPENMPANKFTLAEWAQLEAAGAVFLPYAGRRSGGYGNHTNRDDQEVVAEYNYTYYENYLGTYWTSTAGNQDKGEANYVYTFKYQKINNEDDYQWGKAVIWSENGRYGQSVRLVHIIPRQYGVTYTAGEGEGTVSTDENKYLDGAVITLAGATGLSKEGYRFAGWKFKGQVYNESYTVNNVLANEEIVFEAQWEKDWQTVRDGLTAGNYYTVCYDKKMNEIKGASLWSFIGKDANMAYIEQAEAPYAAGTPYLIYAESEALEAILEVVDNPQAGSNNGLYGTFSYLGAADLDGKGATHMLKNNELRPLGNNNHLDAYRAYVILNEIQGGEPAPAPGRRVRAIPMQTNGATGFENIEASEKPMKLMINGQMYILRGEKMYDATGRMVK